MTDLLVINLNIVGGLLILLALIHIIFPTFFNWKEELSRLSLINRQMMIIHTFFIALMVLLMGVLCVGFTEDLINTKLGKTISIGLAIFWSIRLIVQFFGYSSKLWKGKMFETSAHIGFTGLWLYLSGVFWWNGVISF